MNLEELIQQEEALFVLFGGAHCNVCHAIRPRLEAMVAERFPRMRFVYVDCEAVTDVCAQHGVFSLPVARAWFAGQKAGEWVRAFSLAEVGQALARPYALMFGN
ncbi:co-chaperone YbbN [Sulfurivirga sp.]|uniref:thioredoxin family protein n=1 Tax=Sulfurivirga sp. TaxID=2614236 RepID=UPI0025FCEE17|nr:thioredoxin family protein [Sulfurivirga sp.]